MKKFFLKTTFFLIPFILLHVFTFICYKTNSGDLLDVGYILDFTPNYKRIFKVEMDQRKNFTDVSEKEEVQRQCNVFTIGDSFSEQDNYGYKNYLGAYPDIRLLHYDSKWHPGVSSFQLLNNLLKGDFFDDKNIKYVILESIERNLVSLAQLVDTNHKITLKDITYHIEQGKKTNTSVTQFIFPSDRIVKFPMYNLLYLLNDSACISDAYQTPLTREMFSAGNKNLIFLKDDIRLGYVNNNQLAISSMNVLLNSFSTKLAGKGIKLIVLLCPDKYTMYYDYMVKKKDYPKHFILDYMDTISKSYEYVPAKQLLSMALQSQKDIYFYGDTHWSPRAAKLIGTDLHRIISK